MRQTAHVDARSALFDVYGDHLRSRGAAAPVAALVKMMAPLGIAAPAVRTAISRMVAQRWLDPVRLDGGAGYRLTPRAERRLRDAASRIYRTGFAEWDHRWHLLAVDRISDRARRERVRTGLSYLGYAALRDDTWVSPRRSGEIASLLETEGVCARSFIADYDGNDSRLAADAWDLDGLGIAYSRWLKEATEMVAGLSPAPSDLDAFLVRTRLVHEWRKFLFSDPGLPRELLPHDWSGDEAARFFDFQASRLLPGAGRYVDACLRADGDPS